MPRTRLKRQTPKAERLPAAQGFAQRAAALRVLLGHDAAEAGDQALKLLEEYLESLAQLRGYQGDGGGLGRYVTFLRGREALDADLLDQAETYTQARNCLAHTYGLQVSAALADEVLDFVELLLRLGAPIAADLMTREVRTLLESDPVIRARDLMLQGGYSRLPVLRQGDGIVGLLVERDLVVAQALAERAGGSLRSVTVAEALADDAAARLVLAAPTASRADVIELLRQPGAQACLVTRNADPREPPLGIITHADLLFRL